MRKREYKKKLTCCRIRSIYRNSWIFDNIFYSYNIYCNMQNRNSEQGITMLLINPITIEEIDEKNTFNDTKRINFSLEDEKNINPKLEKKNKKVIKSDDKNKEVDITKGKLKLKKKINGNDDDVNKVKKQNINNTKKARKANKRKESNNELSKEKPVEIILYGPISVQELAEKMCISGTEIIRILFLDGIIVNINQVLDIETATKVAHELEVTVITSEEEVENNRKDFSILDPNENTEERPPIVAVMGHVDHGKTTLLDKIRQTQIAKKEAGGITQKIGSYEVDIDYQDQKKKIVFLDTPGHEAFSSMRSRGVQVTDIAILVVAADDGVKPQTIETIKCIKEAEVPLIVAINKIDKDDANIDNIKQELTVHNLIPDDWGGDIPMIPISAKEGTNLNELLEMIILVGEMLDLKASVTENAQGTVLEANLDKSKGAIATLLVQNGVLNIGDIIVTNHFMARIRGMINSNDDPIVEAFPSSPILVWGLSSVPNIGDRFEAFKDEKEAKIALQARKETNIDNQRVNSTSDRYSLLSPSIEAVINLVIKTDIQGSVEAIINSVNQIEQEKVKIRILYASPGEITETDVDFADASDSTILAFNTKLAPGAKKVARHLGITIKEYNVIYDLFDDIQLMVDDILGPQYEERNIGEATVKAVFPLGKNYVAGSLVNKGKITKGCHIKISRNEQEIYKGILSSLKQFKQDVAEVEQNTECGIYVEEFDEWKEGDIISAFELVEKKKNR